jgi:hypothetical protein
MPAPNFVPRSAFAAYLGRNQGSEFFFTQPWTDLQQTNIPKTLSINRPLQQVILNWRGRVTIAGANYGTVAAEAPQTIIDRIRLFGTYKGNALVLRDISGASCFAWARIFGPRGSSLIINGTRQAELSIPVQQVGATFGNIGAFDLDIWYSIWMPPIVAPAARPANWLPFCLQPRDWNDTLQIQINMGQGATTAAGVGGSSFGTPAGATTSALTAFGSGAGVPQVDIWTVYQLAGPLRDKFMSAVVVQNEQRITQGIAAVASNVRLAVLQKQKTTAVVVKSGVNLTGTAPGVNVFATLSDTLINRTQILVDNRPIRATLDNRTEKEFAGMQGNTVVPGGYFAQTFIDTQTPRTALRGDLENVIAPGAQFELTSDIVSANANNLITVIQEMIYADRVDPAWAGTR